MLRVLDALMGNVVPDGKQLQEIVWLERLASNVKLKAGSIGIVFIKSNLTSQSIDYLLAYVESKAYPLCVHILRHIDFPKQCE